MTADPLFRYTKAVELVAKRLRELDGASKDASLLDVEFHALHIVKIVEALVLEALHVADAGGEAPSTLGKQDTLQILSVLENRRALSLPAAHDISLSKEPGVDVVSSGAGDRNLTAGDLKHALEISRAFLGERDPGAVGEETLGAVAKESYSSATRMRGWLWNHVMVFGNHALVVQLGMLGTPSFVGRSRRHR
jgi:hypothetical protein